MVQPVGTESIAGQCPFDIGIERAQLGNARGEKARTAVRLLGILRIMAGGRRHGRRSVQGLDGRGKEGTANDATAAARGAMLGPTASQAGRPGSGRRPPWRDGLYGSFASLVHFGLMVKRC